MHIDPITVLVFNTLVSLLMSAGLFTVGRGYLGEVQGFRRCAFALLFQGVGGIFSILASFFPILLAIGADSFFTLLSIACYFHALVEFKETNISVRWAYGLVAVAFIVEKYTFFMEHSLTAKIAIFSTCAFLLLFANAFLLLAKQHEKIPTSHKFTGYTFVVSAFIMVARSVYYSFLSPQLLQNIDQVNFIENISYLSFYMLVVVTSFSFVLMCNEKYIAEREQAAKRLAQREHHLRTILEETTGCVKLVARDGTLLSMNPSGLATIEADSEEAVCNQSVYSLITPEYRAAYQAFNEAVCGGESGSMEFEIIDLKGTRHWMMTRAVPFSLENGETVQLAFTQEITERKHTEERLRILSVAVEQSPTSIVITSLDGNLIYVNPKFTEVTGYSFEEAMGQNPRLLQSGLTSTEAYEQLWDNLTHGKI